MKAKPTGFDFPLSFHQILSWVLILLWTISYFCFIIPFQSEVVEVVMCVFFMIFILFTVFFCVQLTRFDPTDFYVTEFKEHMKNQQPFTREMTTYCELCSSPVQDNSKHCMVCYRCVYHFDHHCIWVNNCINGQNYSIFMKLIISFEIFIIIYTVAGVDFVIYAFTFNDSYRKNYESNYQDSNYYFGEFFVLVLTIFAFIAACFNLYLIIFHIWLIKNKMTTFEYISRNAQVFAEGTVGVKSQDSEILSLNNNQ